MPNEKPDEVKPPRIEGVKWVRKVRAGGAVDFLLYHRKTNRRLPDDATSPEFKRAFAACEREAAADEAAKADTPTLLGLIREYQASPDWKNLAESTRTIEQFNVNAVEAEFGEMTLAEIEAKGSRSIFLEWRDELAEDHPRAADAKLTRLAKILKFGLDREKIDRHPLASFKRVYSVDRSEVLWLPEHFAALNASTAPVPMKFAAFLALHTGQRRGDLIALRWRQYDGKGITLTQSKSERKGKPGRRVYIPATKALKSALDALRAALASRNPGDDIGELHILTAASGAPYTTNAFRLAWGRAFEDAGIKPIEVERAGGRTESFTLHFHDIRGTAVTMLAEAGATVPEIATITGHTLATVNRILERYLNRTKALAESAIAKLELRLAV